jgi:nicotinamidase-related amidase
MLLCRHAIPFAFAALFSLVACSINAAEPPEEFALTLRHRVPVAEKSSLFHTLTESERWPAAKTAVVVCDVWDSHHCLNAVRRVQEMAPRMNDFLCEARRRGALIIHAPSDCMQPYEGHPARRRAQEAPRAANLPTDIGQWCHQIPAEEQGVYPIDQSDGGEDDDLQEHAQWESQLKAEGRNPDAPWRKQIDLLQICDEDAISDRGEEVWDLLEQRGIQHVMLLGVHTNMCVLGRPFGLRQLAKNGKRVVLVRDLTDTMYNPQRPPFVQHHSGTDLIVEHIEKYVCPTVTSDQLLGGQPFRFGTDRRKHVAIVMSEDEYRTEQTLTQFAREALQRDFRLSFFYADADDIHLLPGIEQLAEADVALISVRRRVLPKPQLDVFRKFVADGKPIVAIRTTSHAFALRDGQSTAGRDVWPEFDRDVLGGNYQGHHDNQPGAGPPTRVWVLPEVRGADILRGLPEDEWSVSSTLYKTQPLGPRAKPLLMGRVEDRLPHEPVTWTNTHIGGGRVFYTSLGHPDDFQVPAFRRLLLNGVYWAAGLDIPGR